MNNGNINIKAKKRSTPNNSQDISQISRWIFSNDSQIRPKNGITYKAVPLDNGPSQQRPLTTTDTFTWLELLATLE